MKPSCRSMDAGVSSTTLQKRRKVPNCTTRSCTCFEARASSTAAQKKMQKMPSCRASSVIKVRSRRVSSEGRASSSRTAQKTSDQACRTARKLNTVIRRLRFDEERKKQRRQEQQQDKEGKRRQREGTSVLLEGLAQEQDEERSSVPEDWQWCVLALLPLRKVLQFRAVCKSWNAVLSSPEFGSLWFPKHSGWLVMARAPSTFDTIWEKELIAFDTSSSTWLSLSTLLESQCSQGTLADLGGPFCSLVTNGARNHEIPCLSGLRVTSNASGIMCFLCSPFRDEAEYYVSCMCMHDHRAYYLMVLNPVTGSSTRLPPNPKCAERLESWFPFPFNTSLQSLPANHYRLFLWEDVNGYLEFYDSSSRSWTVGRAICDQRDARFATAVDLEQADLMVFLAAGSQFSRDVDGLRFWAYSAKRDEWCQVRVPPLPLFEIFLDTQIILRHQGRILLAAVVDYTYLAGFVIWELQQHPKSSVGTSSALAGDWVEVGRASPRQDLEVIDGRYQGLPELKLTSFGSLICMTGVCYGFDGLVTNFRPLVYNIDNGSWYHLPPYKGDYDFMAVCGLQPSFL